MAITAVFFDFIGTTILENNNDVVLTCFQKAFDDFSVNVDKKTLQQHRGKDKEEMILEVLKAAKREPKIKTKILASFKKHFTSSLDQFSENKNLDVTIEIF